MFSTHVDCSIFGSAEDFLLTTPTRKTKSVVYKILVLDFYHKIISFAFSTIFLILIYFVIYITIEIP
jgi:hypothetical protein